MITIRETQERALSGKVVDQNDFDMKVLPTRLKELVERITLSTTNRY